MRLPILGRIFFSFPDTDFPKILICPDVGLVDSKEHFHGCGFSRSISSQKPVDTPLFT